MTARHEALAVTARLPLRGAVKTRLAAAVGDEVALLVYRSLLSDTIAAADALERVDTYVALLDGAEAGAEPVLAVDSSSSRPAGSLAAELGLPGDGWHLLPQRGADLGERLGNLFADLFLLGYDAVGLVNGDSPGLPSAYLEHAYRLLADGRPPHLVLGPAADGGFYLIATDRATWEAQDAGLRSVLAGARMGSSRALADVVDGASRLGITARKLPLWVDVDDIEDLPLLGRLGRDAGHGDCDDELQSRDEHGLTSNASSAVQALRGEPLETLRDVYLHVTNRCGRGCPHCYNRPNPRHPDELSTAEWRDVVDQCVGLGTTSFVIIGGDPFLRDDLFELIAFITDDRDRKVRLFFNGRCDTETAARLAAAGHGRLRPLLSIDGTRNVNDAIRGPGNYQDTLAALRALAELGLQPVVNTVLLAPVLPTLPVLARAVKEAGAAQIHLILPHERGGLVDHGALIPAGQAMLRAVDDLAATAAEIDLCIDNFPAWRRRLQSPRDFCTAGCRDIAIDPFGKVYACTITCGDPAFVAGDLRQDALDDIWRHAPALRLIRAARARDRAECAACPVVDACGGECWVQAHYAAQARGEPAGLRAPFPYCDLVRPLFQRFRRDAAAGEPGATCGSEGTCDIAAGADGGQTAAGETDYALFDCI